MKKLIIFSLNLVLISSLFGMQEETGTLIRLSLNNAAKYLNPIQLRAKEEKEEKITKQMSQALKNCDSQLLQKSLKKARVFNNTPFLPRTKYIPPLAPHIIATNVISHCSNYCKNLEEMLTSAQQEINIVEEFGNHINFSENHYKAIEILFKLGGQQRYSQNFKRALLTYTFQNWVQNIYIIEEDKKRVFDDNTQLTLQKDLIKKIDEKNNVNDNYKSFIKLMINKNPDLLPKLIEDSKDIFIGNCIPENPYADQNEYGITLNSYKCQKMAEMINFLQQ